MALKTQLPHILAVLNVATVATLLAALKLVREGKPAAHRAAMLVAGVLGAAFLVLYLTYHFSAGLAKFGGAGLIRPIYFTILVGHIVSATVATPVVPYAYFQALSGRIEKHRRVVRIAWPLWMFVAVSGLVVYVMTIHLWPYGGA